MKIQDIIDCLESQGEWVNRDCTRDHILIGDTQIDIDQVYVCWVATLDVIEKAIENLTAALDRHTKALLAGATVTTVEADKPTVKAEQAKPSAPKEQPKPTDAVRPGAIHPKLDVFESMEEMERSCAKFQFLGNYAEV